MRLLRVELTRMRARRAVLLLVLAAFVVPAFIWAGTAWNTRPISGEEQRQVAKQIERQRQEPMYDRELERCLKKPNRYGLPDDESLAQACDELVMPQVGWYASRSELSLARELTGSGPAVVVVLTVLLMLIGTTFVGHDWNTGSMSNQLLFEPRRHWVWAAKGAAVLLTALVAGAVVLTSYWTGLWLLAESRGITTPDGVLEAARGQVGRSLALASFAALGSYAVTMLFRSTVATLGVMFATALVAPLLLAVVGFDGYPRYLPHNNVGAVVNGSITFYDETQGQEDCLTDRGDYIQSCGEVTLTASDAGRYFGSLLLLALVPSVVSFRVRDVP